MHDLVRILGAVGFIVFLSWIISTADGKNLKMFKSMMFWCIVVPVVGTTLGILVILLLKSMGVLAYLHSVGVF